METESLGVLRAKAHERLLARATVHHRAYSEIKGKMHSLLAGIAGEQRVLSYIRDLQLPWPVLWDVNLEVTPGQYVQIDVLVLTPAGAIVYEAKNMAGRLRFEEFPARLDKVDGDGYVTDRYDCPMLQLEDEIANLRIWFHLNQLTLWTEGAVVMTGSAIIEKPPANGRIFSLRQIREHLIRAGKAPGLSIGELRRIADDIQRQNRPYLSFPLIERFNIHPKELDWGPVCESCQRKVMKKSERLWICPACGWRTSDPYASTLEDWFILRSRTLTNRQVRGLFEISSPSGGRLLRSFPLEKRGDGRSVYYVWDYVTPLTRRKLGEC